MKHNQGTGRFCGLFSAAAAFLIIGSAAGTARAQTTVINGNGGITVHNPNGTTTHINNGGVVTSGRTHRVRVRHQPTVRITKSRVTQTTLSGGSVAISGNDRTVTVTSKNGTVNVTGNDNKVTVRGNCRLLAVSGNDNRVTAERVGEIDTSGNNNSVFWRTSGNRNGSPRITQTGNGNSVSRRR